MSIDEDVIVPLEDADRLAASKQYTDGVTLAASMLAADKLLLGFIYPLLIAPAIWVIAKGSTELDESLLLSAIERGLMCLFFLFICRRWMRTFFAGSYHLPLYGVLIIGFVSMAVWGAASLSIVSSQLENAPEWVEVLAFALMAVIGVLGISYYFYFFPALLGCQTISEIRSASLTFVKHHRWLPAKVVITSMGLSFLYYDTMTSFSPDGRSLVVQLLTCLGSQIYWLVSTYLSLGIAFSIAAKKRELSKNFDPYIQARFDTLRLKAPRFLHSVIHPRNAANVLVLAAALLFANAFLLWNMAPAATIQVLSVTVNKKEQTTTVVLTAADPKYQLRGLKPVLFHIQGETGTPVTSHTSTAILAPERKNILMGIPPSKDPVTVTLTFDITDRLSDFDQLTDLYLWYGNVKLGGPPLSITSEPLQVETYS